MAAAIPLELDDELSVTNRKLLAAGMVQPDFTPVELVGYEDDEAGSPLVLDNG